MPSHRIQPCPPSIPYVTHTARNSTHATQRQAQGRGGTRQGCRRGGGRQQQAVARLSPILLTPPTTQTAWRKSVKTLTDLVMIISSYVFCLSGVFSLYYFVLNETLGSVTCGICCWGTDLSAADEAKTNIFLLVKSQRLTCKLLSAFICLSKRGVLFFVFNFCPGGLIHKDSVH